MTILPPKINYTIKTPENGFTPTREKNKYCKIEYQKHVEAKSLSEYPHIFTSPNPQIFTSPNPHISKSFSFLQK
jgi:hypothetical protein